MATADTWDTPSVKGLLRLTSQKLGQLQERKDAQGQITRRDIATLLQQGNIGLARAKAQNLIKEDASGDLLEILEMYVGMLLEHIGQLEQSSPSPIVSEAASSIIFAASQTESKELNVVRDMLVQRLGSDFALSAISNRDNYVSPRVISALSAPPPSAAKLNDYLSSLAKAYNVKWEPELRRQDIVNPLSEMLDPGMTPVVDLPKLRKLCSNGLPDEPVWLRPRLWKILLGFLPVVKSSWATEHRKHRESYYDLIRRVFPKLANLPPPTKPLVTPDSLVLTSHKQLVNVVPGLFMGLENGPENPERCPLDPSAPDDIRVNCAAALDERLGVLLKPRVGISATPEVRLEPVVGEEASAIVQDTLELHKNGTTLLESKPFGMGNVHPKHSSALLRLLYLHCSINPGTRSPYVPSLLVPMYSIMCLEVEPQDQPHVEADTFWLFEIMLGEFSELEDEGGQIWTKKLSERLAWADQDLSDSLRAKGLDPALPHYSYRWLAPILTQTLPFPSFILVWDALFACSMRNKQANPKIDYLLDICAAMLIRARNTLFRLGKGSHRSPGLWTDENDNVLPPPPPRAWEFEDAFLEGISFLQRYPVEAAGGIERILQTAVDLSRRRSEEAKASRSGSLSLGERLKVTMWKGFTNQVSSPNESPERSPSPDEFEDTSADENSDDGNDTEKAPQENAPRASGLTSRLATTVWRGITNQTSMEPPPSPLPPPSPSDAPIHSPSIPSTENIDSTPSSGSGLLGSSGFWRYAEKLKDSDTAATISKVSSNWKARGILASWGSRSTPNSPMISFSPALSGRAPSEPNVEPNHNVDERVRRGSLPPTASVYSPPPRPAFFRPPRDSMLPHPRKGPMFSLPNSPEITDSEGGLISKAQSLQASLMALTSSSAAPAPHKSGPRPLLLNSSSLMTTSPRLTRSATNTPAPEFREGPEGARHLHRDSQSSISSLSLSPNDFGRPLGFDRVSGWDSDSLSRVVPLNRKSLSPMAPGSRLANLRFNRRPASGSSTTSSDRGLTSPAPVMSLPSAEVRGWGQVDSPTAASPSAPKTPASVSADAAMVSVVEDPYSNSVRLSGQNISLDQPSRKIIRKKTPPPSHYHVDDNSDSSSALALPRSARTKNKRLARPGNLHLRDPSKINEQKGLSPNSLAVEWPGEYDWATTPRASSFDVDGRKSTSPVSPRSPRRIRKVSGDIIELRPRKLSAETPDPRTRKISTGSRSRKTSTDKDGTRKERDSAAEEGDDEGYDDLLSAYESEEGPSIPTQH